MKQSVLSKPQDSVILIVYGIFVLKVVALRFETCRLAVSLCVKVEGRLRFADALKEEKGIIQLVDASGKPHRIQAPEGMMSDIVKPLWEREVIVTGSRKGKAIVLEQIEPLD